MRYHKCLLLIFESVERLSLNDIYAYIPDWEDDLFYAGYSNKERNEILETIIDYKTHTP